MIVAIMQPYLFPYLGYFQLMDAVDCFVFYDDAQYMKGGWVNRNRILHEDAPRWWTYPVVRDNFRLPIRQRRYHRTQDNDLSLLGKLDSAYRRAPGYVRTMSLVRDGLDNAESEISTFNVLQLRRVASELGIACRFVMSSEIDYDRSLSGQDRVVEICRCLGATSYINSMGGLDLYQRTPFERAGMQLRFLRPQPSPYPQLGGVHVPFLSIVDVLMFNSPVAARTMLAEYELLQTAA